MKESVFNVNVSLPAAVPCVSTVINVTAGFMIPECSLVRAFFLPVKQEWFVRVHRSIYTQGEAGPSINTDRGKKH